MQAAQLASRVAGRKPKASRSGNKMCIHSARHSFMMRETALTSPPLRRSSVMVAVEPCSSSANWTSGVGTSSTTAGSDRSSESSRSTWAVGTDGASSANVSAGAQLPMRESATDKKPIPLQCGPAARD